MRSSITIFLTILCIAIMPANAENGSLKVGDKISSKAYLLEKISKLTPNCAYWYSCILGFY